MLPDHSLLQCQQRKSRNALAIHDFADHYLSPSKFASAMQSSSSERLLGDLSSTQEGKEEIVFTRKLGLRR